MKSINKRNVVKKLTAAGMCALMVISYFGITASAAGNYKDAKFENKISTTESYTSAREKLDNTSSCIKITNASSYVLIKVYGLHSENDNSKVDCTYGAPKVLTQSTTYTYLPNLVKEKGYTWARLGFTRAGSINFTASGVWSSDSI